MVALRVKPTAPYRLHALQQHHVRRTGMYLWNNLISNMSGVRIAILILHVELRTGQL